MRATFEEYHTVSGHSIEDDMKKELSGDLLNSLLAIGTIKQLIFFTSKDFKLNQNILKSQMRKG